MRKEKCNVLVVGGGGAGLRAAIAAKEQLPNGKVILVTKGKLGISGVTSQACSDRMAFHATLDHTEPRGADSFLNHAKDIYEIGGGVSDAHLATVLAFNSKDAFTYLEGLGVPFIYKDGNPHQFLTDGSEYARACYTGPYTAIHIEQHLIERFHDLDITLFEDCSVFQLLVGSQGIYGALALLKQEEGEETVAISAPSVVMATGGGGLVYADNVFPEGNSGDGCVIAYRAGAELVNMEFIQFGIASTKTKLNCSGSMMRAVPKFINEDGKEFLYDYFPKGTGASTIHSTIFRKGYTWPVSYEHDTHILDIAVYKELLSGGQVFLDYSKNPEGFNFNNLDAELREQYKKEMKKDSAISKGLDTPLGRLKNINPESVEWLNKRDINLDMGDQVEIAICAQHFQGGIKINSRGETAVPGLFAAGECAGGQHGANRPGGNALLDGQVFGKISGTQAALRSLIIQNTEIDNAVACEVHSGIDNIGGKGQSAESIRLALQKLMNSYCSVVRTGEGLRRGLIELKQLCSQNIVGNSPKIGAFVLETRDMIVLAEAILKSSLLREESRGPHLRFARLQDMQPIPRQDPQWQRYIIVHNSENGMELETREPIKNFNFQE